MKIVRFLGLMAVSTALLASNVNAADKVGVVDKAFQDKMTAFLDSDAGREQIGKTFEVYMQERQAKLRKQQEDKEGALLEEQFKNPVKIEIGGSPTKGPETAKVTIIEFSDFQCPYCTRGKQTMDEIAKMYPNDVKIVFKHLPLPFHDQAMPAAKASMAAHKQGKFFEMHDELFANQQKLGQPFFEEAAKKLGLDLEKFKKDMSDPEIEKGIKADMALAEKHEIRGTPGFFVNGVAVKGAYPPEHFKMIIDRWLNGTKKG